MVSAGLFVMSYKFRLCLVRPIYVRLVQVSSCSCNSS